MIICLEGVDGAGKSTLAAALVKEINKQYPDDTVTYLHASQLQTSVYEAYYEPLRDYVPGSGQHFILDRWHLGEEIYGPLYRKQSAFSRDSFVWIEMFLGSIGVRLWNITQPLEVLQERLKERGEDFLQEEHIQSVLEAFKEKSKESALFAGQIAPNLENVYELAEHLILDAEFAEMRAKTILNSGLTSYIGHTFSDPRTLLVVDNKGANKGFHPERSQDAKLVYNSLRDEFVKDFAVVSSRSKEKLQKFLSELYVTGIIAYDESVSKRLDEMGIKHVKFDAPDPDDKRFATKISVAAYEAGK
jgi:gluconate kinase